MPKIQTYKEEIIYALEDHGDFHGWVLNKKTGEIIQVFEDGFGEDVDDLTYDKIDEDPERYLFIEPIESRESFRIMESFIETLSDIKIQNV